MTESESRSAPDVEALVERALEQRAQRLRRRFAAIGSVAVVAVVAVLWGGPALAQAMCSPTLTLAGMTTFCADQPAQASQVNTNFLKIIQAVEAKIGPLSSPDVTVTGQFTAKNAYWTKILDSSTTCTPAAPCTVTVNGPADRAYKIVFQGFLQPGVGVDSRFLLQINNATSGYRSRLATDGDYTINELENSGFYLARTIGSQQILVEGEVDFFPSTYRPDIVGVINMDQYQSNFLTGGHISGAYTTNQTTVTKLTFTTNQAGSFFFGPLQVYALGPP